MKRRPIGDVVVGILAAVLIWCGIIVGGLAVVAMVWEMVVSGGGVR